MSGPAAWRGAVSPAMGFRRGVGSGAKTPFGFMVKGAIPSCPGSGEP